MIVFYLDGMPGRGFDRYVPFVVGGVFVVMGSLVLRTALKAQGKTDRMQKALEKYEDAPWRVRPEWRSNAMVSTARLSRSLLLFTLLWNAISWPAAFLFLNQALSGNAFEWPVLFVTLFPLIGLGFFIKVLVEWRRNQKFGSSSLTLDTMPGRLGRPIGGAIKTGVPTSEYPEDGFRIKLTCYRQYVRYTRDSDGDRRKQIERDVLWRDETTRTGRAYGDGSKLTVPFTFEVPTHTPPSTLAKSENRNLWEVEIDAAVPGLDYHDAIEIPVFPAEASENVSASSTGSADDQASIPGAETSGPTDRIREATGDGVPTTRSPVSASAQQMEPLDGPKNPSRSVMKQGDRFDDTNDFDGLLSEGTTLTDAPGQFELHFSPRRSLRSAVLLGGIGLVMVVGGGFLFGASLMFAVICVGIGGLLVYGSIQKFTNDTVLTIRGGMIELSHDGFGMPDDITFSVREVTDVRAAIESVKDGNVTYAIFLVASEDADLDVAKKQAASAVRIMNALDVEEDDPMRRRMEEGTRRPQVQVVGGFERKAEAEWLAKQILDAAQREAAF